MYDFTVSFGRSEMGPGQSERKYIVEQKASEKNPAKISFSIYFIFSLSLYRYKYWIHGVCWGTPLAETLIIMILSGIDGDNVSGLCLVGAINHTNLIVFFLLPLFLKLGFGIVCLFSGTYFERQFGGMSRSAW